MAGNSIAKGVLTLVPKFEGDALSSIEKQLEKSGKTGAAKMSGTIGAGLKKLAAAGVVIEAGKLLGETFSQSFNEAARYEQLFGGVEKIFDEMDTSTILADAKNAFKDLNMSMNDYMETINDVGASFSATMGDQKGYDVARQGLLAIADYSSGTGKNLDVLKDKFAMITRSTSSYQSIADQFSGILPATSDGFLKAAQGAGLLSDSYKKLTDVPVAEYQAAVAGMLELGVKDLGLYGNTAKETEGTVSGSLAALKASWDNLLVAMGNGEDIEAMAGQLVDSFIVALKNIIPLATQVLIGMGKALLKGLGDIAVMAVNYVAGQYANMEQSAVKFFNGIVDGIANTAGSIFSSLRSVISSLPGEVRSFFGQMASSGSYLIQGLIQGLWNAAGSVANTLWNIASNAVQSFKSFFGIASPSKLMRQMGGYIGEGLALGIGDSERDVDRAMESLMDTTYGSATGFGVSLNSSVNAGGRATNADVVGAINTLHNDLYEIIKDATPDGLTGRQFGRLVHKYA